MKDSVLPVPLAELRRRFAFRPEIALLYDRSRGLEHHLDATAVAFVTATFDTPDPVTALTERYAVGATVLARDLRAFWSDRLADAEHRHPERKSGAPHNWARVDVPFPLALEVELTRACNWHCGFCYNVWKVPDDYGMRGRSDSGVDPSVHMDLAAAEKIIEEAAAGGCLRMRFSGGEPTLHPHYREIIGLAATAGLDVELFTNGTRLTAGEARHLAGLGLRVALLSVHGLTDTHVEMTGNPAASTHAWRGMRAAVDAGISTIAETLVCQDNLAEMPELTRRLVDIGVHNISFMPYVPYGPLDPRRPVLLREIVAVIDECTATARDMAIKVPCAPRHCLESVPVAISDPVRREFDDHCAAGILWASVSYDGRFRHCPHSGVYAGHIDEGIAMMWRDRMVPTVRRATAPTGVCGGCGQFDACGGGCHLGKVTGYGDNIPAAGRRLLPLEPVTTESRCGQ